MRTLPTTNLGVQVEKHRLAATAVAPVKAVPGIRRPNLSRRKPPARYDAAPATPEAKLSSLVATALRRSTWLANRVKRRPAGSSSAPRGAVVAAIAIRPRR